MSIAARRFQQAASSLISKVLHYSLWPSNPTPAAIAESDTASVELGAKFSSTIDTAVLGVRFYKSEQNMGPHSGSLWTTNGTLLATVAFTNETANGWQEAYFASPVAITASTTYVVSYFTPVGYYSEDTGTLAAV